MSWKSDIWVQGIGIWAPGLTSYSDLVQVCSGSSLPDSDFQAPKPEAIPSKERRRAGLMINLAVEVAHQACEQARVDKSNLASVFVSGMGDTDITDYMCRKLTQQEKLLSPTKFHNSVHNAPSGYWSISAENRAPSTFVAGGLESVGMGLLEAASLAVDTDDQVLLVGYDIANKQPFDNITPIPVSLGFALVLGTQSNPDSALQRRVTLTTKVESNPSTDAPARPLLRKLQSQNPAGQSLALLEALVSSSSEQTINIAAGPDYLLQANILA